MIKTIIFFFIAMFYFPLLDAQICIDCGDLGEVIVYPRFWADPEGLIYQVEAIDHHDKTGIWTFFKVRMLMTNFLLYSLIFLTKNSEYFY